MPGRLMDAGRCRRTLRDADRLHALGVTRKEFLGATKNPVAIPANCASRQGALLELPGFLEDSLY